MGLYQSTEKFTRNVSQPAIAFFACRIVRLSPIAQVEYQGQPQNTRILERKPLIDTSYRIGHGLELKYFHLAQFLLNSH